MKENNPKYRTTDIKLGLNKLKVKALKSLRRGLDGIGTQTEILTATAILDLLATYEPTIEIQNK
jgi:hypothetical protein